MAHDTPEVYVVDDDEAVRATICQSLRSAGHAYRDYASAEAFLADYEPSWRGCLLLDICMPGMSGLDVQDRLAQMPVSLPVIIVTGHADIETAVTAMRGGALDVLTKPFGRDDLLNRVNEALQRDAELRQAQEEHIATRIRLARLTPREREVLDLIVAGKHTKGIAYELDLSPKTVESYRASLMVKMAAENVADLVRRVVAAQLVS
jgi:two-component system response regulator FixJ